MKKSGGLDGWPGWPEGCWWEGRPRQQGTDPGPQEAAPSARPTAAVDAVVRSLSWGSGGLGDCTWQLARPPARRSLWSVLLRTCSPNTHSPVCERLLGSAPSPGRSAQRRWRVGPVCWPRAPSLNPGGSFLLVQTVFSGPLTSRFLTARGSERASFYPTPHPRAGASQGGGLHSTPPPTPVLEGLLREVGFTSLSKELAWHLGRNLWPQDPGTVRDACWGEDRGSWLQTWPGGDGSGEEGPPGLELQL